jgi:HD-GYP domain-containing protein (c-di-GMP phosphodiesterase class II)
VGGENVGCINVTDKLGGEFTAADIAELGFVAEAAAISLKGHLTRRELEQANYDTIRALVMTVEAKDPYVHGHSMRVQTWATAIGRELGLDESRLQMLACAAELHDIGKLAVPDQVLSAARPLTGSEWTLVRQHPFRGVQMIEHIGFLKPALPAILHHHERIDGQGYPQGLTGDRIPLEARILAVVDSYDAMTSNRPYRKPLTHEEAAAELCRCIGTQFDGRCVETFLRILGDEGAALAAATAAERPALSER